MTLTNFSDLLTLTKKRCNIDGVTDFDDVIATGLNEAYFELKRKEPEIVSASITSSNKLVALPGDMDYIIDMDQQLYADEYRKGKYLVLQRADAVTFNIRYAKVPNVLQNTDIPDINKKYWYAISTYGCFAYYQFKKKHEEAQSYMQSYYNQLTALEDRDMLQTQIQSVYDAYLR